MNQLKLIGPFTQLLTLDELPLKGAIKDEQLRVIHHAGILVLRDTILEIDDYNTLKEKEYQSIVYEKIEEDSVCLPGFIDSHTHMCFGGTRANEYAMRNAGESYLSIAKKGGGIMSTVHKTRACDSDLLKEQLLKRVQRHLKDGITTIEVKSGYGLSVEHELRLLNIIKKASSETVADLVSTCLAAHTIPDAYKSNPKLYLEDLTKNLFPILKKEKLSNRIDIFIEKGAFQYQDAKPYLEYAKECGFDLTIHADQFTSGASKLGVELGALSVDHLEATDEESIQRIAQSNTLATVLPGASMGLGDAFAPARKLLDEGACVSIASDWNPGSAPMGNLLVQASLLGAYEKLTSAEIFAALGPRAARALNCNDRGILKKGFLADFILFPFSDYQEIVYNQGAVKPFKVYKNGTLIQ